MIFFRKLHKWIGLIVGLQFLIWLLSGLLISFIDHGEVSGNTTLQTPDTPTPLVSVGPFVPPAQLAIETESIDSIALDRFITGPIYRVVSQGDTTLFDARTGDVLHIDRPLVETIARNSYRGTGNLLATERLDSGSDELRDETGTLWRVDFDDDLATRVFIAADDGSVLAHRNSRWKLVDFLLMLHFMDYVRADSFNNPQIIVFGFATLWLAISGVLLVINSFSRADFLWVPGVGAGGSTVRTRVSSGDGTEREVAVSDALSYYAALSQQDVRLPSNCDGSGSCGLCRVRYTENTPEVSAVDREWIDSDSLADGVRLACQHHPRPGDAIVVPDMALQAGTRSAEVVSSRWLTPLLKEIRLKPDAPVEHKPGDYLEFQVPKFEADRNRMNLKSEFAAVWDDMKIPQQWSLDNSENLRRTYSIATAPSSGKDQELAFTVRFAPPPVDSRFPPGFGSSYMCGLQNGDRIEFRGPAGEFRLVDSDKEKIFIGGGAGMAPLRSMALHLLENQGWQGILRFWYGARNQAEILYRQQFEALAKNHVNFEWQVALSEAEDDSDWQGHRGLIHQTVFNEVLSAHPNVQYCEYYLCGPPQMLAATRKMLADLGVPESLVRFDDFGN